jgi:hypothetical protein
MLFLRWPAVSACALVGACSSPFTSGDCTLTIRPAITVEVREMASGRPLADSAAGVARSGAYVDSLKPFMSDSVGTLTALQAYGPAGTYRVELRRPGFQDWVREGVRVTANRCGDNTVALRADLAVIPTR